MSALRAHREMQDERAALCGTAVAADGYVFARDVDGADVYGLIFAHVLGFTQAANGRILVPRDALDEYRSRVTAGEPTTQR